MTTPLRSSLSRLLLALAFLAALGAGWVLLAQRLAEPPFDLGAAWALFWGALVVRLGGWAGWAYRQVRIYPVHLQKAEALWAAGGPPEAVEALLDEARLAKGELGYRVGTLRGHALLAQGQRDHAWLSYLQGELARLPFPLRYLVWPVFRSRKEEDRGRQLRRAERLLRLAPRMARLRHLIAALHLRTGVAASQAEAWQHLAAALTLNPEDPLLLEDALLAGLKWNLSELREQALGLLLGRHLDPRLRWDRAAVAALLAGQGRATEALLLARSVPPSLRNGPELWAAEAAACRALGDLDAADQAVEEGLKLHPSDFRLWMESHAIALEDRAYDDAFGDLEEARKGMEPGNEAQAAEWDLRRAEFAWWIDGDPEAAREHLSRVPTHRRGDILPPLELHLRVALGECEAAFPEIQALCSAYPKEPGVLLLHGKCLAGMDAWDALKTFLEEQAELLRGEASFWHLRGLCLAHLDKRVEAREDLERAARMDPASLRHLLDAGHACAELGEWERSEGHWRQALHLEDACEEALIQLSEARLALHDTPGAVRCLRECLLHHPDSGEAQLRLAELEAQ